MIDKANCNKREKGRQRLTDTGPIKYPHGDDDDDVCD